MEAILPNPKRGARQASGRERIFLSLGSNVGRRPDNLRRALGFLSVDPEITVVAVSRLYSTQPVGYTAQRDFLNGAVELRSRLGPRELLRRLEGIEARLGKSTPFRNGPRRIDIDLVLYGGRVVLEQGLTVPHPRMHARRFVLAPLSEIAPRAVHPLLRRTAASLLAEVDDHGRVRPWGAWVPARASRGGRQA